MRDFSAFRLLLSFKRRRCYFAPERLTAPAGAALSDLRNRIHELGKILAVAGGMIERIQARIRCCFRQRNAERMRLVCENDFVPLNGVNLVVKACYGSTAKKPTRGF